MNVTVGKFIEFINQIVIQTYNALRSKHIAQG